jgi:hypothetical protein
MSWLDKKEEPKADVMPFDKKAESKPSKWNI